MDDLYRPYLLFKGVGLPNVRELVPIRVLLRELGSVAALPRPLN